MKITLIEPNIEDYWYEQQLQSDPNTMSYNAGYNVSFEGYHYDTGCIDFPKSKWKIIYDKRKENNNFFAYIKDESINKYIGYCNYHYDNSCNRYECGLIIEAKYRGKGYSKQALKLLCDKAKENGIKELYDSFELNRQNSLKVFESAGFSIVEKTTWKKFNKDIVGCLVKVILN